MNVKAIIERFGGQTALATYLGKGQSTVAYWAKAGTIPARWHDQLLDLAAEKGVALSPHDFMADPTPLEGGPEPSAPVASPVTGAFADPQVNSPFLFYASNDGSIKVQVMIEDETVWAAQKGMAEIFGVDVRTVSEHLQGIFATGELDALSNSVLRKFRTTASDGKAYETGFYSLDAIISVGYRVNSMQATQFRQWATKVLKSYLIKGFAVDEDRLKQGKQLFGKDYFDELLEKIREIRASERRFYQKITDLYAQCSIDYDKDSPITQQFYAHVQDKLHYAIHGHTAAELIKLRADSSKPHMGLQTWKNEARGGKITKLDVTVGKNYLTVTELEELNRLVSMYLDWAENFARRQMPLRMQDWIQKLDGFLEFNAYSILNSYGNFRRDNAERAAITEYEKFRVIQDTDYRSDFDEVVDAVKAKKRLPKSIL
jgi:hypothetical protein